MPPDPHNQKCKMKFFSVKEKDVQISRNGEKEPEVIMVWNALQPDKVVINTKFTHKENLAERVFIVLAIVIHVEIAVLLFEMRHFFLWLHQPVSQDLFLEVEVEDLEEKAHPCPLFSALGEKIVKQSQEQWRVWCFGRGCRMTRGVGGTGRAVAVEHCFFPSCVSKRLLFSLDVGRVFISNCYVSRKAESWGDWDEGSLALGELMVLTQIGCIERLVGWWNPLWQHSGETACFDPRPSLPNLSPTFRPHGPSGQVGSPCHHLLGWTWLLLCAAILLSPQPRYV